MNTITYEEFEKSLREEFKGFTVNELERLVERFHSETLTKDENKQLINMLINQFELAEELAEDLKDAFCIEEKDNQIQECIDWIWEMRTQIDEWVS